MKNYEAEAANQRTKEDNRMHWATCALCDALPGGIFKR